MKTERIYVNGSYHWVEYIDGDKRFTIYNRYGRKIADGNTLKEACEDWDCIRKNHDDLWDRFCLVTHKDKQDELHYEKWLDSITGKEMFDIMCDEYTNVLVDWNEIEDDLE